MFNNNSFIALSKVLISIISFLPGLSLSNLSPENASDLLSIPEGCHAISHRADSYQDFDSLSELEKAYLSNNRYLWKFDIFCIGDTIHINKPVFTNGGSFYLLAQKVIVNQPIDTRVYRLHNNDNFYPPAATFREFISGGAYKNDQWSFLPTEFNRPNLDEWYGTTKTRLAFDKYYECSPSCRSAGQLGNVIARLPDGASPPIPPRKIPLLNGLDAPHKELNYNSFKSGDIHLLSSDLIFGETTNNSPMLLTQGIPGGKGGLGNPYRCIGWTIQTGKVTFSCVDSDDPKPALNGSGSSGSDAGSVYIFSDKELRFDSFKSQSNVSGGTGSNNEIIQTPHIYGDNPNGTFVVKGHRQPYRNGNDGTVVVRKVKTTQLLEYFIEFIAVRETFLSYDYLELAYRAEKDKNIISIRPFDYLAQAFDKEYRSRLITYVEELDLLVLEGKINSRISSSSVLCGKHPDIISEPHVLIYYYLLKSTCDSNHSQAPLVTYMSNSGGFLNIADYDVSSNIRLDEIIVSIAENKETWTRIQKSLVSIDSRLADIFLSVETHRLETNKRHIEGLIASLEQKKAEMENNSIIPADLQKLGLALGAAGAGAGALVSMVKAINIFNDDGYTNKENNKYTLYTKGEKLQQGKAIYESGMNLVNAHKELKSALEDKPKENLDAQISEYREDLNEVLDSITKTISHIRKYKMNVRNETILTLERILEARRQYGSTVRATLRNVPDYLRLVFTSYLIDPSGSEEAYRSNSEGLRNYILYYPDKEVFLRLWDLDRECVKIVDSSNLSNKKDSNYRESVDCVRHKYNSKREVLTGTLNTFNNASVKIPLYNLRSGNGNILLRTYGITDLSLDPLQENTRSRGLAIIKVHKDQEGVIEITTERKKVNTTK